LDKIESWIVDKFSDIQNKHLISLLSDIPLRKDIELSVSINIT